MEEPKRKPRRKAKATAYTSAAGGAPGLTHDHAARVGAAGDSGPSATWDDAGRAVGLQQQGMTLEMYLKLAGGELSDDDYGEEWEDGEEEEEEDDSQQSAQSGSEGGAARLEDVNVKAGHEAARMTPMQSVSVSPISPLSPANMSPALLTPSASDPAATTGHTPAPTEHLARVGSGASPAAAMAAPALAAYNPLATLTAPEVPSTDRVGAAPVAAVPYSLAAPAAFTAAPFSAAPAPFMPPAMLYLQQLTQVRQQQQHHKEAAGVVGGAAGEAGGGGGDAAEGEVDDLLALLLQE